VFNVGTGHSVTLNEVYATLAEQIGFKEKPIYGPGRVGDIRHSLADISRAKAELGYQPNVQFREGLRRTVEWYLAENEKKPATVQA
jgi:nucleoside-diphosphate-sugar epimerase